MGGVGKWIKKQAKSATKIVKDPVKWAENAGRTVGKGVAAAAPVIGKIPGVGQIAAPMLAAAGSIAGGGNMQDHLKAGLAAGIPLGKIPGLQNLSASLASKVPGGVVGNVLKGAGQGAVKGVMSGGGVKGALQGAAKGGAGALPIPGGFKLPGGGFNVNMLGIPGGDLKPTGGIAGGQPGQPADPSGGGGWMDILSGVLGKVGGGIADAAKGAGTFAKENPELVGAGLGALGGYFDSAAQERMHKERMLEDQRQFDMQHQLMNKQHGINAGQQANTFNRQLETNPIRDQAIFLLQQRMGMTPQAFKPRDMFNESTSSAVPQHGGIDLAKLAAAAASYRSGMGGTNPSVAQGLMAPLLQQGGAPNATIPSGRAQPLVPPQQSAPAPQAWPTAPAPTSPAPTSPAPRPALGGFNKTQPIQDRAKEAIAAFAQPGGTKQAIATLSQPGAGAPGVGASASAKDPLARVKALGAQPKLTPSAPVGAPIKDVPILGAPAAPPPAAPSPPRPVAPIMPEPPRPTAGGSLISPPVAPTVAKVPAKIAELAEEEKRRAGAKAPNAAAIAALLSARIPTSQRAR